MTPRGLRTALGLTTLAALGTLATHVRVNLGASLPWGLYLLDRRVPRRSDLILLCLPTGGAELASARQYLPPGSCPGGIQPVGKILFAAPGDVVEILPSGIVINGNVLPESQPRPADSCQRPLPHYPYGRYHVSRELWVYAPHPRSFDSRYFGPAPAAAWVGTLSPLWTSSRSALGRACETIARANRTPS